MKLFKKKISAQTYDKTRKKPVIKASICNGEQIAGFKDRSRNTLFFCFEYSQFRYKPT